MEYRWCKQNSHFKASIVCDRNIEIGRCIKTHKGCKLSNFYSISDDERIKRSERMAEYHIKKKDCAHPEAS